MSSAYRPPRIGAVRLPRSAPPGSLLLAGDLHCHVAPPDGRRHVARGLDETVRLARREGLDFVVLTPHVWSGILLDDHLLAAERDQHVALAARLARLPRGGPVFIAGIEYTDFEHGHVVVAFGDMVAAMDEAARVPSSERALAFFQRWREQGGLLSIAHPLLTGLDSFLPPARNDMSWKAITSRRPVPRELVFVDGHAQAYEAYNVNIAAIRDEYLFDDQLQTLEDTLRYFDVRMRSRGAFSVPVGGSDSHVHVLRATTWVLAQARTEPSIRDAIVAGRVCVRSPEACTFEVRAPGGAWRGVGAALAATRRLQVRAGHPDLQVLVNGVAVTTHRGLVDVPSGCSVVRARVGEGYSGAVTVGCDWRSDGERAVRPRRDGDADIDVRRRR